MTMNKTGIGWTHLTWNPVSGCDKISEGCKFCYAEQLAEQRRGTAAFPNGFDLTMRPHKMDDPRKLKTPSLIFVNSMSDLFWEKLDDAFRDRVVDVMEATPQHQYQVLTKRPIEMLRYSKRRILPPNFWAGTSIENQRWLDTRLDLLRAVRAEIRFVSAEPLLGELIADWHGISWVITGGESGNHLMSGRGFEHRALVEFVPRGRGERWRLKPDRLEWLRRIRDDVKRAGAAYFHKQHGGPKPDSGGRTIDGQLWDEFPTFPKPRADKQVRLL